MRLSIVRFTSSLALLLGAAAASAQTPTATVRGIVIDQTDARLPKAQVTITRDETHETRRTSSDPTGYFTFAELPAGGYTIQAELAGFSVFRQKAQLAVGSDLWVQAQLAVATTAVVTTGVGDVPVPILEAYPGDDDTRRRATGLEPAARRPELPGARAPCAGNRSCPSRFGELDSRRFCAERQRRSRRLQQLHSGRRLQRRPQARHSGGEAAGRCDSGVRSCNLHLRRIVRPECGRSNQRLDAFGE